MTGPQGGNPPQRRRGIIRGTLHLGWSLFKKVLITLIVLFLLCCTPCGAIAFIGAFSGVTSIVSLLSQNKCTEQVGTDGSTGGGDGGNVNVPNIVKNPPPALPGADVGGAFYSADKIRNAWIIVDVAKQRGMSDKGLLIAMATAHKESGWFNNPGGDRDSAGLFQQRPSAGWGTQQEVTDPWYATNTFFGGPQPPSPRGLVDVPGWENMTVAQAAEQVQHSGFPSEANYAPHVTAAQAMLAHLNHPIDGVPVAAGTNGDSCNNAVVGGRRAEIVRIARNEIGTVATGAHCTKYGPCDFWCAYFVRWVWQQAGITGPALFDTGWARGVPTEVMASNGVKGSFKVHTQGTRDGNPQPGDALVYGTPTQNGGGTNGHIGIVVEVHPDGKIDTVEGDTGPSPGAVSFIQNIDPATVTNGTPDTYIGGYVAPPGG